MVVTSEVLRRVPLLRELEAPILERIAARLAERRFPKGTLLFSEGDPCPGFWIVKEGAVHILRISAAGRVQILETCLPGGVFALVSAVDGGPYPASAEVCKDAVLIFFPCEDLLAAMQVAPATATAVAKTCAARLRRLTKLVSTVALHDVRERVAGYLAREAEARGTRLADGRIEVILEGTQQEVARRLGMAREVYARTLRRLEKDGLIEQERERVWVRDLARLRRAAN